MLSSLFVAGADLVWIYCAGEDCSSEAQSADVRQVSLKNN